jgi:hypothetical protein
MKINFLKKNKDHFSIKKGNINPNIYWMWIFSTGLVLTLVFFSLGFYMFQKINSDSDSTTQAEINSKAVKKEKIDKALNYFKTREETSGNILNSPAGVVDPSL